MSEDQEYCVEVLGLTANPRLRLNNGQIYTLKNGFTAEQYAICLQTDSGKVTFWNPAMMEGDNNPRPENEMEEVEPENEWTKIRKLHEREAASYNPKPKPLKKWKSRKLWTTVIALIFMAVAESFGMNSIMVPIAALTAFYILIQ